MPTTAWIIALVVTLTVASAVSRRVGVATPLVLLGIGGVASFVPTVPAVELSPELVLGWFLPPLLYAATLSTSVIDFRHEIKTILMLSVALVLFTTVVVGGVVAWLLPVPLAVGLALGAVVAPPDAVAASAIARKVGMPRRMVTILEGESLVNDATALVALYTAILAFSSSVSVLQVTGDFVRLAVGGVLVGMAVALVTGRVRTYVTDDITDTALSLVTPFLAYLIGEELHVSGVLAVVVAGLWLNHASHYVQTPSSRVLARTNWRTISYFLENAVFLLIGLEVSTILSDARDTDLATSTVVLVCVAVPVAVVVARVVWVVGAGRLTRLWGAGTLPLSYPAAISWAGMRGVVTLAAAFVLPETTPHREVLVLVALVVVVSTLVLQGASLPAVLRRLGLRGPTLAEDALVYAGVTQRITDAGLRRLDEVVTPDDDAQVIDALRARATGQSQAMWERLGGDDETPSEATARLRLEMLHAQRDELIRVRDEGVVDGELIRRAMWSLDVEETIVGARTVDREDAAPPSEARPSGHPGCEHMGDPRDAAVPATPQGCAECLRDGTRWVHLRLCVTCGHVGCCDSSTGQHASAHFREQGHPVVRSFETGESWQWCFVDEVLA